MGSSREFIKYRSNRHLFGSRGTDDDKHLDETESNHFIADESLIVEEKITGAVSRERLHRLIGPSQFDSNFEKPLTGRVDNLMEGLYLRTESAGRVSGRAKFVRPEFVEKVKQSTHWQHQAIVPYLLKGGANIWS